jgi:cell division protein FtsL
VATRTYPQHAGTAHERAAPRSEGRQLSLPSLVTICIVVIGLAGLSPLILSSRLVSTSSDVQQLERARNNWEARLQELEAEIASLGSLARIEKEARERLGMVPPTETAYVVVDVPAPEDQLVPLRFLPPPKEEPRPNDSLWEKILGWIPLP